MNTETALQRRSSGKCELCSSEQSLSSYEIPPNSDGTEAQSVYLCSVCKEQIENPEMMEKNHWHCLNDSMWSEHPPVQVMAWRILKKLTSESWAQDLLSQLYLADDIQKWAESGSSDQTGGETPTIDSNGAILADGDNVTLIKDLDVKGANFTAKRGTIVRKISLTDDPTHIEGKVSGQQIFLKTCFLKKA